jgi:hypothetical protein
MRARFLVPLLVAGLSTSAPSVAFGKRDKAAKDNRVTPRKKKFKDRKEARAKKDFSEAGTRRGAIEFTLGSAAVVVFGVLIGRGAWELAQGQKLERTCADGTAAELQCTLSDPPSRGNKIAAGLSFGFAVPMAIAAGFLFAHGARIHRDYKAFKRNEQVRLQLVPVAGRRGGGVGLRLRF